MDYSPPGSSIQGILQARILEWLASLSSRGSSQSRDRTQVSHIAGRFFTVWATREATTLSFEVAHKTRTKVNFSKNTFCRVLVTAPPTLWKVECLILRPWFDSWVRKICWRRDRLPTPVFLGFPCGSAGKESACNVGDLSSMPGLGRSLGEGKGYPLQYSGLENCMECVGPWGRKESDRTEWLSLSFMSYIKFEKFLTFILILSLLHFLLLDSHNVHMVVSHRFLRLCSLLFKIYLF